MRFGNAGFELDPELSIWGLCPRINLPQRHLKDHK